MKSNFNKTPTINIRREDKVCYSGWEEITHKLRGSIKKNEKSLILIETYHGVNDVEIERAIKEIFSPDFFYNTKSIFKSSEETEEMVFPFVTDDRVFGYFTNLELRDYLDEAKLKELKQHIFKSSAEVIVVYGPGSSIVAQKADMLLYFDMPRWEIQQRMRKNKVGNLGVLNKDIDFSLRYKQAYFNDWRVLDKHKLTLFETCDFFIDTTKPEDPKMLDGESLLDALHEVVQQPFRVVPFFDPGVWGGQWLKEVMDLDRSQINYAWGFDCVPEENSLLLQFEDIIFETPSLNLVFREPEELLGACVYKEFGAEFPIRFDFLDTVDGGNLSLQVHPTTKYIKDNFGMDYTQDESYYMLDAKENAFVYLGLQEDVNPTAMISALKAAQEKTQEFDAEKYVNKWDIKKHDHVLIPAGTVHCSGKDSVVLEISATPYIFTFKLWDWGRVDFDGKPRPINIEHGKHVIQWNRKTQWTKDQLINKVEELAIGDGWKEERTGLHPSGFIETRRHWFSKKTLHKANGSVNVINLVEGREVIVESPTRNFEPFIVHYAETFILPSNIKEYTITPYGESEGKECATLKAFVRCDHFENSK